MKRIDFSNVNIEMELGVFQPRDTRSEFANVVFQAATTLELSDGEFEQLTAALRHAGYRYSVIRDLEAADQSEKPTPKDEK